MAKRASASHDDTAMVPPWTFRSELATQVDRLLVDLEQGGGSFFDNVELLAAQHGDAVYSEILATLSQQQFAPAEARAHWQLIARTHRSMERSLGPNADLRLALSSHLLAANSKRAAVSVDRDEAASASLPVEFGNYLLEERLAVGGMAEVFAARLLGPGAFLKRVAIKRILPQHCEVTEFVDMFLDEARIAARFTHPNLVQVYDLMEVDGQYAMATELIDGKNLLQILNACRRQRRSIPIDMAAYLIATAASGLDYAHRLTDDNDEPLGVIHRDISPANLMVTWSGALKVIDFGVAKHNLATARTQTGRVKGKLGYLSPEAVLTQPSDHRCDIFSLGVVLYELLTMTPCFKRSSFSAVTAKVSPPSEHNPAIPPELETLAMEMLARKPGDRPATTGEITRRLHAVMQQDPWSVASETREFLHSLFTTDCAVDDASTETTERTDEPSIPWVELEPLEETGEPTLEPTGHAVLAETQETTEPREGTSLLELEQALAGEIDCAPAPQKDMRQTDVLSRRRPAPQKDMRPTDVLSRRRPARTRQHASSQWVGPWAVDLLGTRGRAWPFVAAALLIATLVVVQSRDTPGTQVHEVDTATVPITTNLQVLSEPPGATVFVDGEQQTSVTPLLITGLAVGSAHEVRLQSTDGVRTAERLVRIDGPQVHVLRVDLSGETPTETAEDPEPVQLPKHHGWLTLGSNPRMLVDIDGVMAGSTPIRRYHLAAGEHEVLLHHGTLPLRRSLSITVEPGEHVETRVALARGRLALAVTPRAHVYLRNKRVGTTPIQPLSLWAGEYELRLFFPANQVERLMTVNVTGGDTTTVEVQL